LKGLLTRVLCKNNRRKIEIDITNKGLDLLKGIDGTMDAHQENIAKNLTVKEIALLNDLLTKIRINK
jgi:DNA-binding MarR family transcriptional regulator